MIEDAKNLAECEDFFVLDSETGEWLLPDGEKTEIEQMEH